MVKIIADDFYHFLYLQIPSFLFFIIVSYYNLSLYICLVH